MRKPIKRDWNKVKRTCLICKEKCEPQLAEWYRHSMRRRGIYICRKR